MKVINPKILIFICFVFFIKNMKGQETEIDGYRWEKRILLIVSEDEQHEEYQKQIDKLTNKQEELDERNLLVFLIRKDMYKILYTNNGWNLSNNLYNKYSTAGQAFEIILIGLDGGIKLRKIKSISDIKLFGKIDSMPMRKYEIEHKGNKMGH